MNITNITPDMRLRALLYYFGWKGGTIHQISELTGVSTETLLYSNEDGILTGGFSAVRTCDQQWRTEKLIKGAYSDWGYWRDVMKGFWATGPLDSG